MTKKEIIQIDANTFLIPKSKKSKKKSSGGDKVTSKLYVVDGKKFLRLVDVARYLAAFKGIAIENARSKKCIEKVCSEHGISFSIIEKA